MALLGLPCVHLHESDTNRSQARLTIMADEEGERQRGMESTRVTNLVVNC